MDDAATTLGEADALTCLPTRPNSNHLLNDPGIREAKIQSPTVHEEMIAATIWVEGRTDRLGALKRLQKQVSRIGLPFKVYRAVTPQSLPTIVCDHPIFNTTHEIACLSSHLSLIRDLSSLNLTYALLLEDDAILHNELNISDVVRSAPADWEILALSTSQKYYYDKYKVMAQSGGPDWLAWQSDYWGSYAYIVKGSALKKLSSRFWNSSNQLVLNELYDPFGMLADKVIFRMVKTYLSRFPWASFDRGVKTTIQFKAKEWAIQNTHIAALEIEAIWAQKNNPAGMQSLALKSSRTERCSYNSIWVDGLYIAITFDDGPHPTLTPRLLDILKERQIHATFFLVGKNIQDHPEIVQRQIAEGHEIGNHSWDHPALNTLSESELHHQLSNTSDLIKQITGQAPTIMRPPYGATTSHLNSIIDNSYGMKVILWSVDPKDWKEPGADLISTRILQGWEQSAGVKPGAIILSHDIHEGTIEAMPSVLDALLAQGYKFVSVSELLAMEGKKPAPTS